ncbi:MAG: hypothetical protein Q6373_017785 [Candidatus Sigynarchaeota archaeon]
MVIIQNNSSKDCAMANWTEGLGTLNTELLKKREQLIADGQKFFEAGDYEHCYDSLRAAYEISAQLKDKESMKFIKGRMEEVDKHQKTDFVEKLTSTFRSAGNKKRTQEELTEGLASAVEILMNGAFTLEDKLLEINKALTEKITGLEERLKMREQLSEAMAEQIGSLTKKIDELTEKLASAASAPAMAAPAQSVPGMQPSMGVAQGNMPLAMAMPPGMQPGVPPGVGAPPVPGVPPGVGAPPVPGVKGPPSLPLGAPGSIGPPPGMAPPGCMGPPPSMGPPGAPPPKTAIEAKMPERPMDLRGSLVSELNGVLAKRRKALEE